MSHANVRTKADTESVSVLTIWSSQTVGKTKVSDIFLVATNFDREESKKHSFEIRALCFCQQWKQRLGSLHPFEPNKFEYWQLFMFVKTPRNESDAEKATEKQPTNNNSQNRDRRRKFLRQITYHDGSHIHPSIVDVIYQIASNGRYALLYKPISF